MSRRSLYLEVHGPSGARALLDEWSGLHARAGNGRFATSREWTEAWLAAYGDAVEHRFAVARVGGVLRGLCLLCAGVERRLGPFPLRTLHLGTAGERDADSACVEYNSLLVEDDYRTAMVEAIVTLYRRERAWDALSLDGLGDDLAGEFAGRLRLEQRGYPSRYFNLARARAEGRPVLDLLGKSTRSNLRRQLRRGAPELEWAETVAEAEDILAELFELHQARWRADGEPGAFASRRFRSFVGTFPARLLPSRRAAFVRVRAGGQTLGCLCLLVDGNRVLDYVSGMARAERASPGMVTHLAAMQAALERGFDAYDFLKGEHQHKKNLSTGTRRLVWADHRRPRLKYRVAELYRQGRAALERLAPRPAPDPALA